MNRQQRRKLKKQGKPVPKKEAVINVKKSDLMQYAKRAEKKAIQEVTDLSFSLMMELPIYVLNKYYGFGKKRLNDFMDHLLYEYEHFNEGYIDIQDLHEFIKDQTGIEVMDNLTITR